MVVAAPSAARLAAEQTSNESVELRPPPTSSAVIGSEVQPTLAYSPSLSHVYPHSFLLQSTPLFASHAPQMIMPPMRAPSLGAYLARVAMEERRKTMTPHDISSSQYFRSQAAAFEESKMAADWIVARERALVNPLLSSQQSAIIGSAYRQNQSYVPQALPRMLSAYSGDTSGLTVDIRAMQSQPKELSEEEIKCLQEEEALVYFGSTGRNQRKELYFDTSVLRHPDPKLATDPRRRGGVTGTYFLTIWCLCAVPVQWHPQTRAHSFFCRTIPCEGASYIEGNRNTVFRRCQFLSSRPCLYHSQA